MQFFSFSTVFRKVWPNNQLVRPPTLRLVIHSGKSWIRHWFTKTKYKEMIYPFREKNLHKFGSFLVMLSGASHTVKIQARTPSMAQKFFNFMQCIRSPRGRLAPTPTGNPGSAPGHGCKKRTICVSDFGGPYLYDLFLQFLGSATESIHFPASPYYCHITSQKKSFKFQCQHGGVRPHNFWKCPNFPTAFSFVTQFSENRLHYLTKQSEIKTFWMTQCRNLQFQVFGTECKVHDLIKH